MLKKRLEKNNNGTSYSHLPLKEGKGEGEGVGAGRERVCARNDSVNILLLFTPFETS